MKKLIYTVSLSLGILQAAAQEIEMAELKRLNAKFIHNFVTNDTVSHSQIIHRDLFVSPVNGNLLNARNTWTVGRMALMVLNTGITAMKT